MAEKRESLYGIATGAAFEAVESAFGTTPVFANKFGNASFKPIITGGAITGMGIGFRKFQDGGILG